MRYPGGKSTLGPFFERLILENGLADADYAEPYAGGAGLALGLLYKDYVSHIHINDLDRSIYAFWHTVLFDTDEICRMIERCRLTIAEWRRQKAVQQRKQIVSLTELGFSTFYLNRTNRSGIVCSGSVIGGLRQDGEWGIDARFNRDALIDRIRRVALYKSRITLYNLDAAEFLVGGVRKFSKKSLVYLDPPYYMKGRRRLYANYYRPEDHRKLADLLESCPWPWVISYGAAPDIDRLYRNRRRIAYSLDYSASGRSVGAETMFFAPQVRVPRKWWLLLHRIDDGSVRKRRVLVASKRRFSGTGHVS